MLQKSIPESSDALCFKPRRIRKGVVVIELPAMIETDKLLSFEEEMLSPFAKKLYQELSQSTEYKEKLEKIDFVSDRVAPNDFPSRGLIAMSDPPTEVKPAVLTGVPTEVPSEADEERIRNVIRELLAEKKSSEKRVEEIVV